MSVVLPAPFGPSRAKISPRSMSRSRPRSASKEPNRFFTLRKETTGGGTVAPECSAARAARRGDRLTIHPRAAAGEPAGGSGRSAGRRAHLLQDGGRLSPALQRLAPRPRLERDVA